MVEHGEVGYLCQWWNIYTEVRFFFFPFFFDCLAHTHTHKCIQANLTITYDCICVIIRSAVDQNDLFVRRGRHIQIVVCHFGLKLKYGESETNFLLFAHFQCILICLMLTNRSVTSRIIPKKRKNIYFCAWVNGCSKHPLLSVDWYPFAYI